jgi:Tol biopolymer transport system component
MRPRQVFSTLCGVCLAILIAGAGCSRQRPDPNDYDTVDRQAATEPNYAQATLPPNIAPINFVVRERGSAYYVHIRSQAGKPIDVYSRSGTIDIPIKAWRELLKANVNQVLHTDVYVQDDRGRWTRFAAMENRIAPDPIDPYVAYRIIPPLFMYYDEMGLYQRDLTSFSERPILLNRATTGSCINCHSFQDGNPDRMFFHVRIGAAGTSLILAYDGRVEKVDTKTAFNGPTSYRSWHPNGHTVAFAFNTVRQVFHSEGKSIDVFDMASDLVVYDVTSKTLTTSPKISGPERMETLPEWSPDGKYIYFCSGPSMESVADRDLPYKYMKYDLMRISYDVDKDVWGEVEPVVKAGEMDKSIAHPKISPDGRYLLFCMMDCTYFPLYRPESDLYLLDLQTGQFHKAENINSDRAESYHCWSSNGRWVVLSSKRQDGQCTHLYFAYFDREGHFSRPFLLPQRDPQYESSRMIVYNIPEFIRGPVTVSPQTLTRVAWSKQMVKTSLDPKVGSRTQQKGDEIPYKSGWKN